MKIVLTSLRVFDYLFFAMIMTGIFWFGLFVYTTPLQRTQLVIEAPSGKWSYPMSIPQELKIEGSSGMTGIRIEDRTAYIISSPCSNKSCMASRPLCKPGDWNACLQNNVFLYIEGKQDE